jgi:beta-phosphoglucomutase-like phosphatase (HAD superfamily)
MPALIFDLDGTLIDTVYAHVFTWQCAFQKPEWQLTVGEFTVESG